MSKTRYVCLTLLLLVTAATTLAAQTIGAARGESTVVVDSLPSPAPEAVDTLSRSFFYKVLHNPYPNPERAAAMSFVLPGSGQIYNRRLWYIKVPVLYAGYAFLIDRGLSNLELRNRFSDAYIAELAGEGHEFDNTQFDGEFRLAQLRDRADKNYQLSFIGVGILHLVQTLEAYTTAHLIDFDMDESLTLRPTVLPPAPGGQTPPAPGLALGLRLAR